VHLLRRIELHLRSTRTAATRFGRLAARDPRLVFDMRRGRTLGPRMAKRIAAYLDAAESRATGDRR
jgi:hypothetical protein